MQECYILLASQGNSTPYGYEEFYIMVTPQKLQEFVLQVADPTSRRWRNIEPSRVVDDVLARLRVKDDRFRYLNRDVVGEAWALAQQAAA